MDIKKLHETAFKSARDTLLNRFDPIAYIVYSLSLQNSELPEDIPDTDIDDNIRNVLDNFRKYYYKKSQNKNCSEELQSMLNTFNKIFSEIYYQCNQEEKKIFLSFIKALSNL